MTKVEVCINGKPINYDGLARELARTHATCFAEAIGRELKRTVNAEVWEVVDPRISSKLEKVTSFEEAMRVFDQTTYAEPSAQAALGVALDKATEVEQIATICNLAKYECSKEFERTALLRLAILLQTAA